VKPDGQAVAVFCKPNVDARQVLQRVADVLREHGAEMLLDDTAAAALGTASSGPRDEFVRHAQLVVSVGGDGTLLSSARAVGPRETPILGVNLGSLGFLTETRREEVAEVLGAALTGRATIEQRRPLRVIHDGTHPRVEGIALNDTVFSKKATARLFSLSLLVDGEWVADYRADGLIIATPTGSTAYSLAAGGPIVVPSVDALVVAPICPHSLSQRPIIVPGSSTITVCLAEGQSSLDVQVTLDGQVGFPLEPGEKVEARLAGHAVNLVRPTSRTFFTTLRGKLGWGHP
jgi:NAD+ kinase